MMDEEGSASGQLPRLLSAIGADLLAAFGIPGSSTLGHAINSLFRRRMETAREILLEELRRGDKQLHQVGEKEETAAVVYRYARAAQEGAARLNLHLMARVIAGQAQLGNLAADEFLYYAEMLASLRRAEIILIATLHRNRAMAEERTVDEGQTWARSCEELVPSMLPNEAELSAAAQGRSNAL